MNPREEIARLQMDATKEAMTAKRDYDIDEQTRKVDALAQQVHDRVSRLADLASDVRYDAQRACDQPIQFPAGAFGQDTETIDALLVVLTQESTTLANMRAAKATTDEMTTRFEARIEEIADGAGQPTEPLGQVFEMPQVGGYL